MPESTPPTTAREGRWQFRLRVHIATLFLMVMTAAGLVIIAYGYRATSRLLLSAGDDEFLHVAERTADHVRALLGPARLLAELGAQHRITRADNLAERLELLPFWTHALALHPEISAVYVGYANGDFFPGALPVRGRAARASRAPPDAAFLVQSVLGGDRPGAGRYLFVNAQLGVIQNEPRPNYRYDPRTREWYRRAMASAALVRTDPTFFTTREVGTTLAKRTPSGSAVVGVDITLQTLSRHLAESRVTFSSRLALVDRFRVADRPPGLGPSRQARADGRDPASPGSRISTSPSSGGSSPRPTRPWGPRHPAARGR